jgi:hypothetical protein
MVGHVDQGRADPVLGIQCPDRLGQHMVGEADRVAMGIHDLVDPVAAHAGRSGHRRRGLNRHHAAGAGLA